MADRNRYPQIPGTVWWGVRSILQKTPGIVVDERLLGIQLQVQESAARQYILELKAVGILNEEGKSTPLAQKWRLEDSYEEAVDEILNSVYPDSLRHVAPVEDEDRQKAISWFLREGFGQGAAKNKAATYSLIGTRTPNEAPSRRSNGRPAKDEESRASSRSTVASSADASRPARGNRQNLGSTGSHKSSVTGSPDSVPLNINLQIHIGADAGADQIEAIFSAMRRYLTHAQDS